MYSFESRVRYSETDSHQKITLPSIINYLQDCTTFHSKDIGLGVEYMEKIGKAWMLSSWQIIVERYPKMGERIQISTWATGFHGLYGTRNFKIVDEQGERVIYANSIWVFMDINKGRPVRPDAADIDPYETAPSIEMEYADRKIKSPEKAAEQEMFPVRKYHIDTNGHVNNSQYVQMALEYIECETAFRQVRVEYKKSAVLKDWIMPKTAIEQDRTVVELCDREGTPYALVEFKGEII